ncbi:hypothetical protein [Azospirillum endophyticum]
MSFAQRRPGGDGAAILRGMGGKSTFSALPARVSLAERRFIHARPMALSEKLIRRTGSPFIERL